MDSHPPLLLSSASYLGIVPFWPPMAPFVWPTSHFCHPPALALTQGLKLPFAFHLHILLPPFGLAPSPPPSLQTSPQQPALTRLQQATSICFHYSLPVHPYGLFMLLSPLQLVLPPSAAQMDPRAMTSSHPSLTTDLCSSGQDPAQIHSPHPLTFCMHHTQTHARQGTHYHPDTPGYTQSTPLQPDTPMHTHTHATHTDMHSCRHRERTFMIMFT
jgi:hypothetical protein